MNFGYLTAVLIALVQLATTIHFASFTHLTALLCAVSSIRVQAGDWFVSYDPNKAVYPTDLYQAQRATQSKRLKMASVAKVRPSWYPMKPTPA
jgi:hypothetical protein